MFCAMLFYHLNVSRWSILIYETEITALTTCVLEFQYFWHKQFCILFVKKKKHDRTKQSNVCFEICSVKNRRHNFSQTVNKHYVHICCSPCWG